jgi:hypothetical protein
VLGQVKRGGGCSKLILRVHCISSADCALMREYITKRYVFIGATTASTALESDAKRRPLLSISNYRLSLAQCLVTGWPRSQDCRLMGGRALSYMANHAPSSCKCVIRLNADGYETGVLCFLPAKDIPTLHRMLFAASEDSGSPPLRLRLEKKVMGQAVGCTYCWHSGHSARDCPHRL